MVEIHAADAVDPNTVICTDVGCNDLPVCLCDCIIQIGCSANRCTTN